MGTRKNRSDLIKPGPGTIQEKGRLTEPEAIAMAELTKERDFSRVLAFHTQGKEIYWGFEHLEPPIQNDCKGI